MTLIELYSHVEITKLVTNNVARGKLIRAWFQDGKYG